MCICSESSYCVLFPSKRSQLTCYSKAPFVKLYSVIHKMRYNLHGSAFGLDYTVVERERRAECQNQLELLLTAVFAFIANICIALTLYW